MRPSLLGTRKRMTAEAGLSVPDAQRHHAKEPEVAMPPGAKPPGHSPPPRPNLSLHAPGHSQTPKNSAPCTNPRTRPRTRHRTPSTPTPDTGDEAILNHRHQGQQRAASTQACRPALPAPQQASFCLKTLQFWLSRLRTKRPAPEIHDLNTERGHFFTVMIKKHPRTILIPAEASNCGY